MSLGIPVVVSDIPIFREIGGAAATYARPDSASDFAAGVRGLGQPGEWARAAQRSLTQAERFTWEASAERLLRLLTETAAPRD